MKVWRVSVLGAAVLLAATALAANKTSVVVSEPVTVAGQQLPKGTYNVTWEGNGPNLEVKILKGKDVVATTTGHMVDAKNAYLSDAVGTTRNADGSTSLTQLQFRGKKYALVLGEEPAQAASNTK
jgi:hypothetical protein